MFERTNFAKWTVTLSLVLTGGCSSKLFRTPTFNGPADVRKHLTANERGFTTFATDWMAEGSHASMFCYFGDREYRWNDYFIRAVEGGFTAERGSQGSAPVVTFAEAARRAGTTEQALESWIRRARALRIYCVSSYQKSGTIEILLEGSEWLPYGLRYAPPSRPESLSELVFYAKNNGGLGDVAMQRVAERWFYFESKH